jgi:hypothetical protein
MSLIAKFVAATTAFALIAATADAQDVTFRGKIEDGEDICYYCPGFGYIVNGSKTTLSSSTLNLELYVGSHVIGTGTWNGSSSAPNIHVTSLVVTPETFSIAGGGDLGDFISFNAYGSPGDLAVVAGALSGASFVPIGTAGVSFLDLSTVRILGIGTIDGGGEYSSEFFVPDMPAFQGLTVFGQGVVFPQVGEPFVTSPDFKTLGI